MLVYILMTAITAVMLGFSQYFYQKSKVELETKKNIIVYYVLFFLSILPMALVAGLRYEVGTDYNHTYVPKFMTALTKNDQYSEVPFLWLNMGLRHLTDDPVWLFLIMGFLFAFFMNLSIKKLSDHWALSSILLVLSIIFFVSLNNSRQMVALAIAIYGFTFALEKKVVQSLISLAFAMCFHSSMVLLLPFYFLIHWKWFKKYIFIFIILSICILPFMNPVVRFVLPYFKYGYYFGSEHDNGKSIYPYFIQTLGVSLITLYYFKPLEQQYKKKFFPLFLMSTCATLIGFLGFFVRIPEMMSRFLLNFSWANLFLIPMIVNVEKNKISKICILFILIIIIYAPTYLMINVWNNHEVLPYQWIFGK